MTKIILADKILDKYRIGDYITPSDEGEALAIACGIFLATGERADVYFSADGFCNALNFFTSYVMPEKIEVNIFISTGREEPPHKVMTDILPELLELLQYDTKRIFITTVRKE